ncbi:hypothetical protein IEQ34_011428 [Dendrobium chrysotoxum]|uniref:Pentatricopeptide repeat-containing protein n=1 Tax=Dendrobium chrysotoxum TaxID=161865 RepID=A0AAV7GSU8_DENCH|nr:hypothetical protein IEQ34_011428 [Dendrobium chrysotoxum]
MNTNRFFTLCRLAVRTAGRKAIDVDAEKELKRDRAARNANLGKLAGRQLLKADPYNTGAYLSMSNIHASSGEWKEVAEIRSEMTQRGLKKQPGCSWIDIGNKVHVFVSRDMLHIEFDSIDWMLQELHHEMKMLKYASSV